VIVLVHLLFLPQRAVCPPVLARLWRPKHPDRTKLRLASALVTLVAERYPDRSVHLVADAAYAGRALRELPASVTVTVRMRAEAALHQLPPPRTGNPAGPAAKVTGCPS
jgi:hypothetical protein